MASQITVTAKAGPGQTVTAQVLSDISSFQVDCAKKLLNVEVNGAVRTYDIDAATTMTVTISGDNYTAVVS